MTAEDWEVLCAAAKAPLWILVLSKKDIRESAAIDLTELPSSPAAVISLSSVTGEGMDTLEAAIATLFPVDSAPMGSILTNNRQIEAVERALTAIQSAKAAFLGGMTPDAILTDGEAALTALGEITGRTLRDDLVERIFSRFCVGK